MTWRRLVWLALLAGLLAWFAYLYYHKIGEVNRLLKIQHEYQDRVSALEAETAELARLVERILTDPDETERLAREKLGLVGEDEVIYIIEPPPDSPSPTPTAGPAR